MMIDAPNVHKFDKRVGMLSFNKKITIGVDFMGHKNKLSMVGQVQKELDGKLAIGSSKYKDKLNGATQNKVYSWGTYKSYLKQGCQFAKWAKDEHGVKNLADARQYVNEYLKSRSHLSAYTQKLDASALAKIYNCTTKDFIQTKERHRADITRSRGEKVRDAHFSEQKNKAFVDFCKSTGLRRSEITELRGEQLIEKDGKYYIGVTGKGGRYREAPITYKVNEVVSRMQEAKHERVWNRVPSGADIHGYRSMYATNMYNSYARQKHDIPKRDRYCCRKDLKGTWYDKKAMKVVTEALGHSRISIIAEHYIRA